MVLELMFSSKQRMMHGHSTIIHLSNLKFEFHFLRYIITEMLVRRNNHTSAFTVHVQLFVNIAGPLLQRVNMHVLLLQRESKQASGKVDGLRQVTADQG